MFFMFVQLAIISIFKSYPTVGDIALYMAFLPLWSHLYQCKFCNIINVGIVHNGPYLDNELGRNIEYLIGYHYFS